MEAEATIPETPRTSGIARITTTAVPATTIVLGTLETTTTHPTTTTAGTLQQLTGRGKHPHKENHTPRRKTVVPGNGVESAKAGELDQNLI